MGRKGGGSSFNSGLVVASFVGTYGYSRCQSALQSYAPSTPFPRFVFHIGPSLSQKSTKILHSMIFLSCMWPIDLLIQLT